nr:MAG TPA: hypothetical protein [Bacteriophage sp.]
MKNIEKYRDKLLSLVNVCNWYDHFNSDDDCVQDCRSCEQRFVNWLFEDSEKSVLDEYTWAINHFSADFEIALKDPSAILELKELILSHDKGLLEDINRLGELSRRLTDGSIKMIKVK